MPGADTLVFLDTEILGKPADAVEARGMLQRLQGRTHQVVTGVSLIHLRAHRERIFAVSTDVTFRPLSGAQIADYLAKINPLDKAGGYAIQEHGGADRVGNLRLVQQRGGAAAGAVGGGTGTMGRWGEFKAPSPEPKVLSPRSVSEAFFIAWSVPARGGR